MTFSNIHNFVPQPWYYDSEIMSVNVIFYEQQFTWLGFVDCKGPCFRDLAYSDHEARFFNEQAHTVVGQIFGSLRTCQLNPKIPARISAASTKKIMS